MSQPLPLKYTYHISLKLPLFLTTNYFLSQHSHILPAKIEYFFTPAAFILQNYPTKSTRKILQQTRTKGRKRLIRL